MYVFTAQGLRLAMRIARFLDIHIYAPRSLQNTCPQYFSAQAVPDTPRIGLTKVPAKQHPEKTGTACEPAALREQGSLHSLSRPSQISFFSSLAQVMAESFHTRACHIFIGASGIAVRAIAPHLTSKLRDPAVLVMDQHGKHVISLLSGHTGGANHMTLQISHQIGAEPIITTASDLEGLPALDVLTQEKSLSIANPECVKTITSALLARKEVFLHDPQDHLGIYDSRWHGLFTPISGPCAEKDGYTVTVPEHAATVIVTEKDVRLDETGRRTCLLIHPPVLFAGVGCKRGTPAATILECLGTVFSQYTLSLHSLGGLASLDVKKDEPGLREVARVLQTDIFFFTAEELSSFPVTGISLKAQETFGVRGVCEPAALAAASQENYMAELLISKSVFPGVTVAVAVRRKVLESI